MIRPSTRVFYTASGKPLQSAGTICATLMTEGGQKFSCNVHTLGVPKGLISVSQLTKHGHRVAFDSEGGRVSLRNGLELTFAERAGVYSLSLKGVGFDEPTDVTWNPFGRQAQRP